LSAISPHASDFNDALARVDSVEAQPVELPWNLDGHTTLERLRALLRDPTLLNQRGVHACGPAVFFRIWLERDPVAAADLACAMLRDGQASIGSLVIRAGDGLLNQDYAAVRARVEAATPNTMPETADWMLLSSLRDSENVFLDYLGEPNTVADKLAGMTTPHTLAGWLSATNLYSSFDSDTNVAVPKDRQRILSLIPTSDIDVVVFLNHASTIGLLGQPTPTPPKVNPIGIVVPDHFVLMTGPITPADDPAWIDLDIWTWGRMTPGFQGTEFFFENFSALSLRPCSQPGAVSHPAPRLAGRYEVVAAGT
jgi:hypothetical protein